MTRIRSTQAELQDRADRGVVLCPLCRVEKTEEYFSPAHWARRWRCKQCGSEYNAARYAADPERFKAHERAKRRARGAKPMAPPWSPAERKARNWAYHLSGVYAVTVEEYAWRLHEQDFHCALCDATDLHVDHCHATGKFRGLLCSKHNTSIGRLGDNVAGLRAALDYLESCV